MDKYELLNWAAPIATFYVVSYLGYLAELTRRPPNYLVFGPIVAGVFIGSEAAILLAVTIRIINGSEQ